MCFVCLLYILSIFHGFTPQIHSTLLLFVRYKNSKFVDVEYKCIQYTENFAIKNVFETM